MFWGPGTSLYKVFKKELYNDIFEGVERWIVCTPLSTKVFVTLATQEHLE
jgi:hypothetical protein